MVRPGCAFLLAALAFWLVVGEVAARLMVDLKLHGRDSEVGYYLLPNQSGDSLLVGSFEVNPQGLGVKEPFRPSKEFDLLLVGDNLVLGTFRYDQGQRLGPIIEEQTGWEVWPLAAGSWSLWNELRMLSRRPNLQHVDAIVFVLNAKDFEKVSQWKNEYDHPTKKPISYLLYAIQKRIVGLRAGDASIPVRGSDLSVDWKEFVEGSSIPVLVVGVHLDQQLALNRSGGGESFRGDCAWLPTWMTVPTSCFRPRAGGEGDLSSDMTNLNPTGNRHLAQFIASAVTKTRVSPAPAD